MDRVSIIDSLMLFSISNFRNIFQTECKCTTFLRNSLKKKNKVAKHCPVIRATGSEKESPVPRHRRGPFNKAGNFGAVSYLVTSKATLFIRELDGLFAGEVVDLEAQEQNAIQRFVDLVLQARLVVGRVPAAQLSQGLHLLVGVL